MSLEQEIVSWAATRPPWQQGVLRRLAQGEALDTNSYRKIAEELARPTTASSPGLTLADLPTTNMEPRRVGLLSIRDVSGVNALVPDQQLTFGPHGITVVYGDNASGKSGYARLVKKVVRARHREDVLADIFSEPPNESRAELAVQVNGEVSTVVWPLATPAYVGQVSFYDELCGDTYISAESEVTYRPYALFVLDGLVRACDGVREQIDQMLQANARGAVALPQVADGTAAAAFMQSLSGRTTAADLDASSAVPPGAAEAIARLTAEEARLKATDPNREKVRLSGLAAKLERISAHLNALRLGLSDSKSSELETSKQEALGQRTAAAAASAASFNAEPLEGVGSVTWRALWEAARAFSENEAYSSRAFPVTGSPARCVLCQQELEGEGGDRLNRFEAFVQDHTQRQAEAAERQLAAKVEGVRSLTVLPPEIGILLDDLEVDHLDLVTDCRTVLAGFEARRNAILSAVEGSSTEPLPPIPEPGTSIGPEAERIRAQADSLDPAEFQAGLMEISQRRSNLEAAHSLNIARNALETEIDRRRELEALETAKRSTDTTGITRRSTELTRAHVTTVVRDRFTRESDRLKLERVTLEDVGGQKGQLRHRPAFVGARRAAPMVSVLSEGEQTALGLAGFFTEVHLDETGSAIVLDDPVSSLDHVRRGLVANRLAELARDRQVIVFTHDISFVSDLKAASEREGATFTERSIERRGDGRPGVCNDVHPWKARDVRQRLGALEHGLARISRDKEAWTQEEYEKETADWAGKLSETWERLINYEVVGQVADRSTLEVRPKMFRVLARITEEDDRDFQEGYSSCSRWARRHDKGLEINYVAPGVSDMETEFHRVKEFEERVRKYRN